MSRDLAVIARSIIEVNAYLTLATADAEGRPWASPVYYAAEDPWRFLWASSPEALHSRNLAARPDVGLVIFDSHVEVGRGQAVYMEGRAELLEGEELERASRIYPGPPERGAKPMGVAELSAPALHRLYRATVSRHWVLDPAGHPVHGRAVDHRTPVELGG